MPTSRVVEVAAALLERDGCILLAQRPAGTHLAGFWEFPGGKREAGETFEACLARELLEEVGVEVEVRGEARRVRHAYPDRTVEIRFFRCRLVRGEPRALQVAAVAWVPRAELGRYPVPPADREVVEWLSAAAEPVT
ncbi:MAG TPA: (deoxy)nucleoside triphosphate pyrophosphohydrolase [Thermodesulfobacteriota bacterium]